MDLQKTTFLGVIAMRHRNFIVAVGITVVGLVASLASSKPSNQVRMELFSPTRILELRNRGPEGLRIALESLSVDAEASEFQRAALGIAEGPNKEICEAIDQVAGQRYAYLSRLYWYDDWNAAVEQAKLTKKPILVLKMLGKLTDELSCANSRFFRTALYVDPRINDYLRENYVLCWSSVRAVPKITIDFGDGRKMERTITGNSAHYIVTVEGLVLDALPGMYGPQTFCDWIVNMHQLFLKQENSANPQEATEVLRSYHASLIGDTKPVVATRTLTLRAGRTTSKGFFEQPMVKQVAPGQADVITQVASISPLQSNESTVIVALSSTSRAVIEAENTSLVKHAENPDTTELLLANFQQTIALDERQNEQVLHKTIHTWLAESPRMDLESLNLRVYEQLFAMPSNDPWLGLASKEFYSGLCRGGLSE
jgi:hypothetical protein